MFLNTIIAVLRHQVAKTNWRVYSDISETNFYGSNYVFQIPKIGLLYQIVAKVSLTSNGSNLASESNMGSRFV